MPADFLVGDCKPLRTDYNSHFERYCSAESVGVAAFPVGRIGNPFCPARRITSDKELCMADDKFEPREINFRQWLPWTQIFRGFWIALDHKKLLLAAAGILAMSMGWWFISSVTYGF